MAILEQDKVFYSEEANGDKTIFLPITRANNVEGLGRSTNTTYAVGDVVYADTNKTIALKCTTAGTTSDSELDISANSVGDSITDGGVAWQVVSRDTVAIIDKERPIKTFTSLAQLGLSDNATIEEICVAMPGYSVLMIDVQRNAFPNLTVPLDGQLIVNKNAENRIGLQFNTPNNTVSSFYFGTYASWSVPVFSGWKKLAINGALSMPSSSGISISVSVTNYTAPADGWVYLYAENAGLYGLDNLTSGLATYGRTTDYWAGVIPVKKGDAVRFTKASGVHTQRFIYAQSEV